MLKKLIAAGAVLLTAGCATTSEFSREMADPILALNGAASLAGDATDDVLQAAALGRAKPAMPLENLVCQPARGPAEVQAELTEFSDAFDLVAKVGAAPTDTTYAGYIRQLRLNAANAAANPDLGDDDDTAKKRIAAQTHCMSAFREDVAVRELDTLRESPRPDVTVLAAIVAIDQVMKGVLGQVEAAQREEAVRKTLNKLLPLLKGASTRLRKAPDGNFGPHVAYPAGTDSAGLNKTRLGAMVAVRRWSVASRIDARWKALDACRSSGDPKCMGDAGTQATLAGLVADARTYRSLAAVDPGQVMDALDAAIQAANDALAADKKPTSWLDALVGVGDAVSGLAAPFATVKGALQ